MRVRTSRLTLIEMLVVVTIIIVLVSLLLPALNRAREHGRVAACQQGMRQLGMADMLWADDHEGQLLGAFGWTGNNSQLGMEHTWHDDNEIRESKVYREGYLQADGLFRCPTFESVWDLPGKTCPRGYNMEGATRHDLVPAFNYTYNLKLKNEWDRYYKIPRPADLLMWAEEASWTLPGISVYPLNNGRFRPGQDSLASYHFADTSGLTGRGNACFVDGHVALHEPSETEDICYRNARR